MVTACGFFGNWRKDHSGGRGTPIVDECVEVAVKKCDALMTPLPTDTYERLSAEWGAAYLVCQQMHEELLGCVSEHDKRYHSKED